MRIESHRATFPELDLARSFSDRIRSCENEISTHRELPKDLANDLKQAGLFRLLLPSTLGGSQLSLPKYLRCIEAIGEADGSVGWCVGQAGVFANGADGYPPELTNIIWGDNPAAVVATGTPVNCKATEMGDIFQLTGRWRFASGCMHADWLAAQTDLVLEDGTEAPGLCLVPKDSVELGDDWNVTGLRGTGSREYRTEALAVPKAQVVPVEVFRSHCGAATGLSNGLLFASSFGSVGLGIARRAIDSLIDLAQGKVRAFGNRKLMEDEMVQVGLAQAEAEWHSARAFLLEIADECAYLHKQESAPSGAARTRLRLAATNAMRTSGKVVDKAYELAGSSAIFHDHPLYKCFQDIHAITQQIQARPAHFRTVGRALIGLESEEDVR
ncbi:MAG: acyl-CoA dehydrogenase family protein [Pseudomonadales bacterium]|nr:acyl-CoA dehydrogenase family protein [Pseudomonadales bacterium]